MQHRKSFSIIPCILLGIMVLFGCNSEAEKRSTLTVNLQTATARSIVPEDTSLAVTKYVISGDGPNNTHFTNTTTKQSVSVSGLLIGSWTLKVIGQNSAGVNLVEGTGSLILKPEPTTTTITLSTLKGTGTIDLTITWSKTLITNPSFVLEVTDEKGTMTKPTLDKTNLANGSIRFTGSTYAAGSYMVVGKLLSSGTQVAGFAEAVRVVDGLNSTKTINLNLDTTSEVPSTITLVNTVGTPVECTIAGISREMPVDKSVTASIDTATKETLDITWFLDGMQKGTGKTFVFTPTIGEHRLDVIAKGPKQASTGSATIPFKGTVSGKPGVPVFMKQIAGGTNNINLSGATRVAFLPDGKLLVYSEGQSTLQICQLVGNDLQVATTYTATNCDFTLTSVADIKVDETRSMVFISDNKTPKVTKYSYDASTSKLTKILESTNKAWYTSSGKSGDFATLGDLAIDEAEGKLYVTTLGLATIFTTIYDETATVQDKFWFNCGEADYIVQPKTPTKPTYTANNFDGIILSPDDKYIGAFIKKDGVVYTSPKIDGLLGFSLNACSDQSDDITGMDGLTTMAFLSDTAMLMGSTGKLTLVGGDISTMLDIPWLNIGTIASGSAAAGGKTIADVVQIGQNNARNKVYALCRGSKNLLSFSFANDALTFVEECPMGTFVPSQYVISPDETIMIVTSNTSGALRLYRIPK
jgi:hypothetical protein